VKDFDGARRTINPHAHAESHRSLDAEFPSFRWIGWLRGENLRSGLRGCGTGAGRSCDRPTGCSFRLCVLRSAGDRLGVDLNALRQRRRFRDVARAIRRKRLIGRELSRFLRQQFDLNTGIPLVENDTLPGRFVIRRGNAEQPGMDGPRAQEPDDRRLGRASPLKVKMSNRRHRSNYYHALVLRDLTRFMLCRFSNNCNENCPASSCFFNSLWWLLARSLCAGYRASRHRGRSQRHSDGTKGRRHTRERLGDRALGNGSAK